ncbi:MAG: prepilin-type N-terminal cleavage/methylation domain-containing protein [Sulfurimonas sp.]
MRKAFTLIELMISVMILSIIMVFLYKSFAELNAQNKVYTQESSKIKKLEMTKEMFFLDLSLSFQDSVKIVSQDKKVDIVFFQSRHSIHKRINPYIGYIVQDHKLYRIESLKPLKNYPIESDISFDIDYLGEVKNFRLYPAKSSKELYLLDLTLKKMGSILIKIKSFS